MSNQQLSSVQTYTELGTLKDTQLLYSDAADYYRKAVELLELIQDKVDTHLARLLTLWGTAAFKAGEYAVAERQRKRALAILRA